MATHRRKKTRAIAKGKSLSKQKLAEVRKKRGASNVGKYGKVASDDFCGSVPGSFPVNTKKRAKAALALAHNDQRPRKVMECVRKKYPSLKKG